MTTKLTYEISILEDSEDKLALLWNLEHNPAHILSDPFFEWHMTSSPPNSTFRFVEAALLLPQPPSPSPPAPPLPVPVSPKAEPPAWNPPVQLPSLNPLPAISPPPETPESTTMNVDLSPLPPSPSPPSSPVEIELSVETSSEGDGSATRLILITSGAALGAVVLAVLSFHYFHRMQNLKGFQSQLQAQAAIMKEKVINEEECMSLPEQQQTADCSAPSLGPLVHTPSEGNIKALPMRMSANSKPQFDDRNRIHPSPKGMKHPSLDLLGEYI